MSSTLTYLSETQEKEFASLMKVLGQEFSVSRLKISFPASWQTEAVFLQGDFPCPFFYTTKDTIELSVNFTGIRHIFQLENVACYD